MQEIRHVRLGMRAATGAFAIIMTVAMMIAPMMHAQALPATPPTSLPATPLTSLPKGNAPAPGVPAAGVPTTKPQHAQVTYVNGQLDIRANDSSLNQILRSISRKTGLKITGGVVDERVFGNYGPAPTSSVLATLLDGTGTNILLLGGDDKNPPELVLTPRSGGVTPPGPNSPMYAAYDDSTDDTTSVQLKQHSTIQAVRSQPNPSASIGTLTPEQIAQQLLTLQRQQQQQSHPSPH